MRFILIIKAIIVIEIFIIIFLGLFLYNKNNTIFNTKTNVSPIDKNTIKQSEATELKYFYDFKPNEIATWSAEFLPKPIVNRYNNDGLNDTQNYSIRKEPNTFRIITLGDSYTYGQNVKTKDNWTEILERKLNEKPICKNINKFEVINFGISGYDPNYEVELYRLKGVKYNPNLVIWTLIDINRFSEDQTPKIFNCVKELKKSYGDCKNSIRAEFKKTNGQSKIETMQQENIQKIRQFYENKIFFIDFYNNHYNAIKDISNVTIFSKLATKEFLYNKYSQSQVHFPDGHPNELGYKIIADVIFDQLFKTNQIPCDSF